MIWKIGYFLVYLYNNKKLKEFKRYGRHQNIRKYQKNSS
jgi:hypothetical protein